jgi:integrase
MKRSKKIRGVFTKRGRWWIRWTCTLGHDHRQPSGESKTAATEEQKAKRAEVRDARKAGQECCPRLVLRARPVLFDEILTDYLDYSRRSKRSHRDDRPRAQRLRSAFGKRLASDIRPKDVEDFKAALAEVRTVATVNHHLKLLKAVFNRAIRQGRLTYNPGAAVRLDQEHNARNRCLSPEEEGRLLKALPKRLRPLVILALHTGMRRGELRALRWADVDLVVGSIHVRRDKAGEGRWVSLNSIARNALKVARRQQNPPSEYVFSSPRGRFMHNLERDWRPALRAAKISDFRFHDLRHTFASRLALAGVDLYTVQRAGGWKTHTMVQRYAHLSPDHIRAAVERLAGAKPGAATAARPKQRSRRRRRRRLSQPPTS